MRPIVVLVRRFVRPNRERRDYGRGLRWITGVREWLG
jgi:hypothetical protein